RSHDAAVAAPAGGDDIAAMRPPQWPGSAPVGAAIAAMGLRPWRQSIAAMAAPGESWRPLARALAGRHRDELRPAAAVADQQHDGFSGRDLAQLAVERGRGGHVHAADLQDHVTRLDAGAARSESFDAGHGHALVRLEVQPAALLGVQFAADQAQGIALLRRRRPRRRTGTRPRDAFVKLAQGHGDVAGAPFAPDLDPDLAARWLGADHRRHVARLVDGDAVDLADHVAALDAGLLG